jgi:hypothetical protein
MSESNFSILQSVNKTTQSTFNYQTTFTALIANHFPYQT